jgi:hypothetical protein
MPRSTPLSARAVVASDAVAKSLGRRLVQLDDGALKMLAAVGSDDLLVILGDESQLPWIDGVTYFGRDDSAPGLLLPTALAPSVPAPVLEAAIRKLVPRSAPVVVMPSPTRLINCGAARAIDRDRLRAWIGAS